MSTDTLLKKLNLHSSVAIIVGSIIGSSIFMKPAVMAQQLPDVRLIIVIWVIAGTISYIGAMINAEVGCMFPHTGGQYVYFQKMYGEKFAFLYGWSGLSVINTAAVAAIAFVFAQYVGYFAPLPKLNSDIEKEYVLLIPYVGKFYLLENIGIKLVAFFAIIVLTFFNYISVLSGVRVQNFFTWLKVLLLVAIIFIIFCFGRGDTAYLLQSNIKKFDFMTLLGMVAALSGAFAAFDGWNNIGFVAGEIKDVQSTLPKALFIGLGICMMLYLLTNLAFYYMLPLNLASHSELIATDAITPIVGHRGVAIIALLVIVSAFGAVNGNILACARVTHAMGETNNFFSWTGRVHKKYNTPGNSLLLHGIISSLYIFTGSFDMLADLFVFVTWIFYGFAAYGIIILRKKYPNENRPYRVRGAKTLAILFSLFALFYSLLTIYNDVNNYVNEKSEIIKSLLGLIVVFSGLLVYRIKKWF
jgi:APA family basic amino acid/polyamine antiporter